MTSKVPVENIWLWHRKLSGEAWKAATYPKNRIYQVMWYHIKSYACSNLCYAQEKTSQGCLYTLIVVGLCPDCSYTKKVWLYINPKNAGLLSQSFNVLSKICILIGADRHVPFNSMSPVSRISDGNSFTFSCARGGSSGEYWQRSHRQIQVFKTRRAIAVWP